MPDDPRKRGPRDRTRGSKQEHEVRYRKQRGKAGPQGDQPRQASSGSDRAGRRRGQGER